MGSTPAVRAATATDVGRVREHNEDAAVCQGGVFAVADGMGGHAAGEVASGLAVGVLERFAGVGERSPSEVLDAIDDANTAILGSVMDHPARAGMATTLAGVALVDVDGEVRWMVFNIGDSRVYQQHDGGFRQVSQDHSEVAELVSLGLLTPEEALRHPARNIVTRCLGRDPLEPVDSWLLVPAPGDRYLACTDGLTNEVPDRLLAELLADGDDPQAVADRLVQTAVEAGGHDNVTVVVVLT